MSQIEPSASQFVAVARIAGAFGVQGEIKVDSLTDFPERFDVNSALYLKGAPVQVVASRPTGNERFVLLLDAVRDRSSAETLRGETLDVPEDSLTPLPDGAYYRFQLLGITAETEDGVTLGAVSEVLETGSNDVLVVRSAGGRESLIPNIDGVADLRIPEGRVIVHPIPGLLDDFLRTNEEPIGER